MIRRQTPESGQEQEQEIARRRDDVLRRIIATPPTPLKPKPESAVSASLKSPRLDE